MIKNIIKIATLVIVSIVFIQGFTTVSALGSYTWSSPSASTYSCYNLSSSSTGQYIGCSNQNGDLYLSSDYGVDWSPVTSLGSQAWYGVGVSSTGQYMVASANGGNIYVSDDFGATWQQTNAPSDGWISAAISSNGQDIVVGDPGTGIYVSINGGANWTSYPIAGSNVIAVAMSSSGQYMYAIDRNGFEIYTSDDYGSSWSPSESMSSGVYAYIYSSSSGQYVVAADDTSSVYVSNDYGANWTVQNIGSGTLINNVNISSNGQDLIATDLSSGGYIYESFDGGQTWNADSGAGNGVNGVGWWAVASSSDLSQVVALDTSGYIYSATNPALYIPPPSSQSTTPSKTSNHSSLVAPDTGYGQPNYHILTYTLFGFSVVLLGTGLVIKKRYQRA